MLLILPLLGSCTLSRSYPGSSQCLSRQFANLTAAMIKAMDSADFGAAEESTTYGNQEERNILEEVQYMIWRRTR